MNKILNNQKGSIILGMVAVFVVMTFVISMTIRITNERQLNSKKEGSQIISTYEKDSVIEVFKNLMEQKITDKEYQKDMENEYIGMQDAIEMQEITNEKIKEMFGEKYKVLVTIENELKTKELCQKNNNEYYCGNQESGFNVELEVIEQNKNEEFFLTYEGIRLVATEGKIKANVEEISVRMSK